MTFLRPILIFVALLGLSACAKSVYDSDTDIAKRAFVSNDRPSITLLTMVNNKNGHGGHSSLMIDGGPQRIMYDPAGRWWHDWVPERDDVLYGLNPQLLQRYKSFHARQTHHVVSQKIYVSKAVANLAFDLAFKQGASHDAMCAINVSSILQSIPGFESVGSHWGPKGLMRNFAKLPGVQTDKYFENDVGQN